MHIACLDLWRVHSEAFLWMSRIQFIEQVVNHLCEGFCTRTVFRNTTFMIDLQTNCSALAKELQIQLHVTN